MSSHSGEYGKILNLVIFYIIFNLVKIHQIRLDLLNHSGDISNSENSCRVPRKNHQISENLLDHSGVFCNCVNSG